MQPNRLIGLAENFLRTGLDDKKLARVGVAAIMWNSLELDIQRLAWTIADWDMRRGPLITVNLGNVSLIQLVRNLAHGCPIDTRVVEEIELMLDIFDIMRVRRNTLVHGIPSYETDGSLKGRLVSYSAKDGKGHVTMKSVLVTNEELEGLIKNLARCGEFVEDARRKVANERQYLHDESVQHYSFDDFVFGYRAPKIDKPVLQKHLEALRNQRPKFPSSKKRKQSSQE